MWQNANNEVLLSWFKFQAKIPSRSGVCLQGEWQKYTPPSPPLSKDEALKNIEHSMSIRNLIFGVKSVKVSYMIGYDSLLQMRQKFITKWVRFFITKCDVYYKLWQYTHKACWHVKHVSVLANHIGTLTRIPRCQE